MFFPSQIAYTNGDITCWITSTLGASQTVEYTVRVFYDEIPFIGGLGVTIIGYSYAIFRYRQDPLINYMNIHIYRLLWYPLVLFIAFLPDVLDNFMRYSNSSARSTPLKAAHLIFTHSIGVFNAILYGLQAKSWQSTQIQLCDNLSSTQRNEHTESLINALRGAQNEGSGSLGILSDP